ncbi:MAG: 5'-nucleotidase [Flavobacteriaceae bacterium]|nr:5'-nucleotidase [Flavobacteriaceae bacterium]
MRKLIFISIFAITILACRPALYQVQNAEKSRIFISDSLESSEKILTLIQPYKMSMDSLLNRELAYSPIALDYEGANTVLGNFITDLMMEESNEIYRKKHPGKRIDIVLMNRGGLRRSFGPGYLSVRSMYELMPFENEAVVVTMTGEKLYEMVSFLRQSSKNHPVSGLKFNKNSDDKDFLINGEKYDSNRNYRILTNDYLQNGGDQMRFFLDPVDVEYLQIRLRDMYINYLEKIDTIQVNSDLRYIE